MYEFKLALIAGHLLLRPVVDVPVECVLFQPLPVENTPICNTLLFIVAIKSYVYGCLPQEDTLSRTSSLISYF